MNPNQNNVNGGQPVQPTQPATQPVQPPVQQPVQAPLQQPVQQPVPQQPQPSQPVNNVPGLAPVAQTVMPEQQVVNNDEKKKSSPLIVIILIMALVLFVFNMEKVEDYYNKYILKKTPETNTPTTVETNELLKIGETTNYNKVSNIKFYNFKKGDETNLLFTYEALEKINMPETLGIFIEIYDADKNLIYIEEFKSKEAIEKDTARTYNLSLKSSIYNYYDNSYYALVKTYKSEDKEAKSSITCKKTVSLSTSVLNQEIKYNFKNNSLISYEVNKTVEVPEGLESFSDRNTVELAKEYNNVSTFIRTAVYNNYKLSYVVDLEYNVDGFEPLYAKGVINNVIKIKEQAKEWICE